jgi:hypothetical protein
MSLKASELSLNTITEFFHESLEKVIKTVLYQLF